MTKVTKSASAANSETNDSTQPFWDDQFHRVKAAMWSHPKKGGKSRETISIYRSYKDEKEKWHNVHYYDRDDLRDLREALDAIEAQLLKHDGLTEVAGED